MSGRSAGLETIKGRSGPWGGGEFGSIDDGPSVPPRTSPTNTVQMLMR